MTYHRYPDPQHFQVGAQMTDQEVDHHLELGKAISSIESIAMVLPRVGKRSELKVMQEEMYRLIILARRHANALEKELISLKYEWPNDRFKRVKGVKRG